MRLLTHKTLWLLLALPLAGCLQIDVSIVLQQDGSAVVTERVCFSQALLDLDDTKAPQLEPMLSKAGAEERIKWMGEGVTLVSHKVQEGDRASRESIAVYRVNDLDKFIYVSPFLPQDGAQHSVALKTRFAAPLRDGSSWEHIGGWMGVDFQTMPDPRAVKPTVPKTQPDPPPSPREVQMVRELRPVFGDLLKQFRLKVTFESYAPVLKASFGWRGASSATKKVDLVDFAPDQNNDKYGFPWLDNEEIMLDMLRGRLNSPVVWDHLGGWTNNPTLPVMHGRGVVYFRPSMPLFKRFFEGKTLFHHGKGNVPAKFEEIGYTGVDVKPATTRPATGG
ncbi:MAG: hypothetical protein PHU85_00705 [Phycisphaerae bacterium]|nr:hypothetical protein [Phycisphaerae bacterium]